MNSESQLESVDGLQKGSWNPKAGPVVCKTAGPAGIKVLPNLEALAIQIPSPN
jgi:hypothetical protein